MPAAVEDLADRIAAIPDRRAPVVIACLAAWILVALVVNRIVRSACAGRRWRGWRSAFAYMPLLLLGRRLARAERGRGGTAGRVRGGRTRGPDRPLRPGLARAGDRLCDHGGRVRDRRHRGLRTDAALAARSEPDLRRPLLRDRKRARGAHRGDGARRRCGGAERLQRLGKGGEPTRRRLPGSSASAPSRRSSSRPVASGPTSARRSCCPVGAVVAAVALPELERFPGSGPEIARDPSRRLIAVVAVPSLAVLSCALIDLVSGGNSHLTRSVIDAGGAGDLADIAERRLRLSAHDFAQAAGNPLFWIVVVGIGVGGAVAANRRLAQARPHCPRGPDRRLRGGSSGRAGQRFGGDLSRARVARAGRVPRLRLVSGRRNP